MAAKKQKKAIDEFLKTAKKRLKREMDADRHNRQAAISDLKFRHGADDAQWDEGKAAERKSWGGCALTINLLGAFVDRVVGDMRHLRPRADVKPVDSKGDPRIAKIRKGIIWDTEYQSNAEAIYDYAGEMNTTCGYGAWQVKTRYSEDNPFIQEIYLELLPNPFVVYLQRKKCPVFSDAGYGFVLDKMPIEEFKEEYPDAAVPDASLDAGPGMTNENWVDKDTVTVADYYVVDEEKATMCQLSNGDFYEKSEAEEKVKDWQESKKKLDAAKQQLLTEIQAQAGPDVTLEDDGRIMKGGNMIKQIPLPRIGEEIKIAKSKEWGKRKIKHYLISAVEILSEAGLDGEDVPGGFIPLILLQGKQYNIEGKNFVKSYIRDAKDPQKLINYWETSTAETIALAPKSEWLGTDEQFEGYEQDFLSANRMHIPMLKYKPQVYKDHLVPPPERVSPTQPPVGMFEQSKRAHDNLKSVLNAHNMDMRDEGRELSGVAQRGKQKPSDMATFVFHDNLARGITLSAKIINSMIAEVFDTERDARVRNDDDTESFQPINTTAKSALDTVNGNPARYRGTDVNDLKKMIKSGQGHKKFNDVTVGKYGVVITTAPSYATQRQESTELLGKIMQTNPRLMSIFGDIYVKGLDVLNADVIGARLERMLPPGLLIPKEGEAPKPPLPPAPALQAQIEKAKAATVKAQIEKEKLKIEQLKLLKELKDSDSEIRSVVIQVLKEFNAPPGQHPADQLLATQDMIKQQATQRIQQEGMGRMDGGQEMG